MILTSGLAGCGEGPSRTPLAPPPANALSHITLAIPREIVPGATVQLAVEAVKRDGSVENVTSQSQWLVTNLRIQSPSASEVLVVDSTGLASARDRGEVLVTASFGGRQASASVLILPAGTFRYSFGLRDGPLGIPGVVVEVTEGVDRGLSAVTDESGTFHLFGLAGFVTWRARKAGYLDLTRAVHVNQSSDGSNYYHMIPSRSPRDHSGTYELTITTQADCGAASGSFPDVGRKRTYTAEVRQDGPWLNVLLSGADFIVHNGSGDNFHGQVSSTGEAVLWLGFYNGDYAIAERLGSTSLLFDGMVHAQGGDAGIAGTMDGRASISSPFYPFALSTTRCPTDRFEMIRR